MGKRGPAPKGEYAGKSKVLSTRIRPDTRAALSKAAKTSGRSLSQEIEHRLRRSFSEDAEIEKAFGGRRHYRFMRMINDMIEMIGSPSSDGDGDWLDDPYRFDQASKACAAVFELLRPVGKIKTVASSEAPDRLNSLLLGAQGAIRAMQYLQRIHAADPNLPLGKGTALDHAAAGMKIDFGDVVERAKGRKLVASEQPIKKGDKK